MTLRFNDAERCTLCIKQYKEYRLSAINNSRESIKNRKYLIEFETKFEKSLNTE